MLNIYDFGDCAIMGGEMKPICDNEGLVPYNKKSKDSSRKLRNAMTKEEKCLWERIRNNHLGPTFYRQKPVGDYIVDFYCPKAKLVIEVDGAQHFTAEGIEYDKVRDEIIYNLGFKVLRFSNSEVTDKIDKVVEKIIGEISLSREKISLSPSLRKRDKG